MRDATAVRSTEPGQGGGESLRRTEHPCPGVFPARRIMGIGDGDRDERGFEVVYVPVPAARGLQVPDHARGDAPGTEGAADVQVESWTRPQYAEPADGELFRSPAVKHDHVTARAGSRSVALRVHQ